MRDKYEFGGHDMTLILACLTKDAVFQVSDRRLTKLVPPGEVVDDERNKAVLVNGRVVLGYTGLSEICGERADDWIARVISSDSTDDMARVAERIREAATKDFDRMRLPPQLKYHAFQGVRWFRLKGEADLRPGIMTIDNGIDQGTGSWLPSPLKEFRVSTQFPESTPGGCILYSVGVAPSPGEKGAVVRLVRKCVKHRRATFGTVVYALVRSMRWLSSRNPLIGAGVMAVCLPKRSVEASEASGGVIMVAGPPMESTPTFLYVSATGSTTYFGPHFVAGAAVITGFEVAPLHAHRSTSE